MVVAEKRNRDINNYVRSMMVYVYFFKVYWVEVVVTVVYIQNRLLKFIMVFFIKVFFICGLVIDQMYRIFVCLGAQRTYTYFNICVLNGIISYISYVLLVMVIL